MEPMKKTGKICAVLALILTLTVTALADRDIDLPGSGDRTEEITRVQNRLFALGYYTYKPTGSYGSVTGRAISLFQSTIGDPQTGELTRAEWDVLFSDAAPLRPFVVTVPVTFRGQSEHLSVTGEAVPWRTVKNALEEGQTYTLVNCAGSDSCQVVFSGGTGHGEFTLGQGSVAQYHLKQWLGSTNSFYKIACVMKIGDKNVACSVQWNGTDRVCVYFSGSVSHVAGLRDTEHEALVKKAAGHITSEAAG